MKILVTGACGYKGSVLVPKLLAKGWEVIALDIMWFGNYLPEHPSLTIIKGDVNETDSVPMDGIHTIIHLSSIANDPCGDLNPKLTWETSCLATMRLADKAKRSNVKQFIYASSGSVYGVKTEDKVTEDLELVPISEYNKTKMVAERALMSYEKSFSVQIVRPATVCGLSPRMRFDVSVNMLTMQAITKGEIRVLGGNQTRPNIHIDDISDLYIYLVNNPKLTGVFNAGFENLTIMDIAEMVAQKTNAKIKVEPTNDLRSYRVDSAKILEVGFQPKKTVVDAIDEIIAAYREGRVADKEEYYNLRWMQKHQLGRV